jgi:hypothetical protein
MFVVSPSALVFLPWAGQGRGVGVLREKTLLESLAPPSLCPHLSWLSKGSPLYVLKPQL